MAKDDRIEQLLIEWAMWLQVGDGSGYATMSVLHEDWTPPTSGQAPSMKVCLPNRARGLHRLIAKLSVRLGNTLIVHYCLRLPMDEQAARLECSVSTVHARVEFAHRQLKRLLQEAAAERKEFHAL